MALMIRPNDERVREEAIRNYVREAGLLTNVPKAAQCHNQEFIAQIIYLNDVLRGRIISRLALATVL